MFHEVVDDPGSHTAEELYAEYEAALVAAIEEAGVAAAAERSGVDRATLEAVLDGDAPELTLEEGAAVLAADPGAPDAEAIETMSRDALLMGMTNAVLDVEAVASGIGDQLEAKEIQSKVEGRFPMTLREYALLHQYIAGEGP